MDGRETIRRLREDDRTRHIPIIVCSAHAGGGNLLADALGSQRRRAGLIVGGRLFAVSLLVELDAFYLDHRRCGNLDAGVDGPVVWIAFECEARVARRVGEEDDHVAVA
jgi:CheY-like chemotaxis protein